jgi:hypothetical protein
MPGATPVGSRRRLRALMARGWDAETIAEETGVHPDLIDAVARARETRRMPVITEPGANERIAAAYNRIGDRHPECGPRQEAPRGWAPPAAWEDDQLDLPEGKPEKGWMRGTETKLVQGLAEEARFFREYGGYHNASNAVLAARLGTSKESLTLALRRDAKATQRQAREQPQMEAC